MKSTYYNHPGQIKKR